MLLSALLTGCFAPINSTFESAKMLDKGQIGLQCNYSKYYGEFFEGNSKNLNNNFGFGIGYGISNQFNMKFRYERISTKTTIEIFDEEFSINYIELSNKFQVKQDKMSLSIPLGIYLFGGEPLILLDPRFFFTLRGNEKFELNLIPKIHIFIGDGINFRPGINLGLGFSSNLNEWAIRPEIGFDGYFTIGVGVNYYLKSGNGE